MDRRRFIRTVTLGLAAAPFVRVLGADVVSPATSAPAYPIWFLGTAAMYEFQGEPGLVVKWMPLRKEMDRIVG